MTPRCSIVIPVHNKAALTRQCLDAILKTPPEVPFEIIVVDDASTDSTPELLAGYGKAVKGVRLDRNAGFATACNSGAATAKGEYVVFLNNDTIPREGWLDALVSYADSHPEATVVGSKLLFPDGSIQHAGVVFNFSGDPLHIYAGCPADHPAVNKSRRFQVVTAACLLIDRGVFLEVDGFDTDYHNDLEDVDLCLRLGRRGKEVHYCHESVLVHLESASRGYRERRDSARLWAERWRGRVKQDELDYYLEDGLLDTLRVSPELIKAGVERRRDAEVLQKRSRQLLGLLRESVRVSTLATVRGNGRAERFTAAGIVGARRAGSRNASSAQNQLENQIHALRQDLEAAVGGHHSPPEPTPPEKPVTAGLTGYAGVVEEIQRTVGHSVPEGSTVLVVSKGDDALLKLDGRDAWHFPRAEDGRYRGHHPRNSEDAIRQLEELRSLGADHIVFPQPYFWWFDYYADFVEHLDQYRRVVDEENCVIFDMRSPNTDDAQSPSGQPAHDAGAAVSEVPAGRMSPDEYLALLERTKAAVKAGLPPGATVLVATRGDDALLELGGRPAWHFPCDEDGGYLGYYPDSDEEAIEHLEELRAAGAEYLVFPSSSFWWLDHYSSFGAHLRSRYRIVVYQEDTCIVFRLAERRVADVVRSLLPAESRTTVVTSLAGDLSGLDQQNALQLEPVPRDEEMIAHIERVVNEGTEFLVIAESAFGWLDEHPDVAKHLLANHEFVTRQQYVCEIWELRGSPDEAEPARSSVGEDRTFVGVAEREALATSERRGWRALLDPLWKRGQPDH